MVRSLDCNPGSSREGCLVFADTHYGVDLKITGLFGETINEYSPEIFEARMWNLFQEKGHFLE